MIVVTGGAGLIGSTLVRALNAKGHTNIVIVDHLKNGKKMLNLQGLNFADYWDREDFLKVIESDQFADTVEVVFHLGACSDTQEWDGQYLMRNNYAYSKSLLTYCQRKKIPLIYASSASVYGNGTVFVEKMEHEAPCNMYAFSKWQFDQYVRQKHAHFVAPVVGLRYFNVYGPGEAHKGKMASCVYHFAEQILATGALRLFAGSGGYADGEQRRDFVYSEDVVKVNLWAWENAVPYGIFNVGTGASTTFKALAEAVVRWFGRGEISYIPFPEHLVGHYQSFTQADLSLLRQAGYGAPFQTVEEGVKQYLDTVSGNYAHGKNPAGSIHGT